MSEAACFHCGLALPGGQRFDATVDGQQRLFCCPGCSAVAQAISGSGLAKYYHYRDQPALTPNGQSSTELQLFDQPAFQRRFVTTLGDGRQQAVLAIGGITCAACTWLIEQHLQNLPGVQQASVNLAQHRALIEWRPQQIALSQIVQAISAIGYQAAPWQQSQQQQRLQRDNKQALMRMGVAGIAMMQVGMYAIALHAGSLQGISDNVRDLLRYSSMLMATWVIFYAASPFYRSALRSLRNRHLNMDVPVAVALTLAYSASCWATVSGSGDVYYDSVAMFTFFLLLSRYLEARARQRYSRLEQQLQQVTFHCAWRLNLDGEAEQVPAEELQPGDRILIKPGELVSADAVIEQGESQFNEAVLTGEHLPITRGVGDPICAGSLNGDSNLTAVVSQQQQQSRLATMARLLEQAQASRPAIALMADRVAGYFVTLVLLLALLVYFGWSLVDPGKALWVALSVLVVSCPCALSLATPTALTAALGALRQRGLLLQRSDILEQTHDIALALFDKTGTLTDGQLSIHATAPDIIPAEHLAIARALQRYSSHPIAAAFNDSSTVTVPLESPQVVPGAGVKAYWQGSEYRIGSAAFCNQSAVPSPEANATNGQITTTVYLVKNQQLLAAFTLADRLRPSAASCIRALQQRNIACKIITGDSSGAGAAVARALAIDDTINSCSAEQKLAFMRQHQNSGQTVMAIGDGVNDAALLAGADISIAVNNATDLTKSGADCIILGRDLGAITSLLSVGAATRRIIRQNLGWALGYNALALPLAAAGWVPPYLAALGMSASSLVVVANALRLWRVAEKN